MSHTRKRLKRPRRRFVVRPYYAGPHFPHGWSVHDTDIAEDLTPEAMFYRKRDAQDWARQKNKVICGHS